MPQDKANHMAYGLALYVVIGLWSTLIGLLVVCIVAVAKEIYDSYGHGTTDWKDIVATVGVPVIVEIIRSII